MDEPRDMTIRQAAVVYTVRDRLPTGLAGLTYDDLPSDQWERMKRELIGLVGAMSDADLVRHGLQMVARHVCVGWLEDRLYGEAVYDAAIGVLRETQPNQR